MERDDVLNVRIPARIKTGLRRAAEDDRRSMSNLVEIILGEWLAGRGYMKPAKRGPAAKGG
jgi:hypothetical protein